MPRPAWAPTRESSRMLALGSQACSSRRTIRSPQRAVERQWMRRTSSPCRYSRTSTSSWPTTPTRCGRASPVLPAPPELRIVTRGTTRGVTMTSVVATNCRSNWTRPNGSLVRTVSGPVENRPRTRPSSGYSTTRRQRRSALSTRNRGRLPSSRGTESSSSKIAAGSRPSWPSTIWPVIGDPSGTWAGSMERSQDIRKRARDTRIIATTGSAASSRPIRITSRCPEAMAIRTTATPTMKKSRPRAVSRRHGRVIATSGRECAPN